MKRSCISASRYDPTPCAISYDASWALLNYPMSPCRSCPWPQPRTPGGAGGFNLVGFPGPMPDVVLLENLIGANYVEGVDEVQVFAGAFERIVAPALLVDDSMALVTRMEEENRR